MEFPWEKTEAKKTGKTDISNEDIERLKNKAKKWYHFNNQKENNKFNYCNRYCHQRFKSN